MRRLIAVIDDGVDSQLFGLGELCFDLEIDAGGAVRERREQAVGAPSHGTMCGALIRHVCPDVSLGSVKILSTQDHRGDCRALVHAIDWCVNRGIHLIHMSNGSTVFQDFTQVDDCVGRAVRRGALIIAAQSNSRLYTVPACLPGVLGVCYGRRLPPWSMELRHDPSDGVEVRAHLPVELTMAQGGVCPVSLCNSYTAAAVTGLLARQGWPETADLAVALLRRGEGYRLERDLDQPGREPELKVPVLAVVGQGREALAEELLAFFLKRDHAAVLLTDQAERARPCVERRRAEISLEEQMAQDAWRYQCNLLLTALKEPVKADVILSLEGELLSFRETDPEQADHRGELPVLQAPKAFEQIYQWFETE